MKMVRQKLEAILRWALAFTWLIIFFRLTLMDRFLVQKQFGWLIRLCAAGHIRGSTIDVVFHFASLAIMSFLLAGAIQKTYFLNIQKSHVPYYVLTMIFLIGGLSENLQILTPTRTPRFSDFCINFFGGVIGLAITQASGVLDQNLADNELPGPLVTESTGPDKETNIF